MVIDLQAKKRIYQVLQLNYGLGKALSLYYCSKVGLNEYSLSLEVTKDQIKSLTKLISQDIHVGVELKRDVTSAIQNKVNLRTYQGIRHSQGLPVNGQNTKNNASTARLLNKNKINIY